MMVIDAAAVEAGGAPVSNAMDITAREVEAAKADLPAVEAVIVEGLEGVPEDEQAAIVKAALAEARQRRDAAARVTTVKTDEFTDAVPPTAEVPPEDAAGTGPSPVDERGGDPEARRPPDGEVPPQEPPRSPDPKPDKPKAPPRPKCHADAAALSDLLDAVVKLQDLDAVWLNARPEDKENLRSAAAVLTPWLEHLKALTTGKRSPKASHLSVVSKGA
jgi:hypothetical protein